MQVVKKIIFIVAFLSAAVSAWTVDWFAFGGSLGTAVLVDGDEEIRSYSEKLHRVVLETDATMEFVIHPAIRISLGSILLADFKFKDGQHYNSLDYSFYGGIRVYPGLGGLRLGVDYNLGRRTDFIDVPPVNGTYSTAWGNGFRFLLEYDFRWQKTGFMPIVGGSWRHIPRGGSSDHILSVYFKLLYR